MRAMGEEDLLEEGVNLLITYLSLCHSLDRIIENEAAAPLDVDTDGLL